MAYLHIVHILITLSLAVLALSQLKMSRLNSEHIKDMQGRINQVARADIDRAANIRSDIHSEILSVKQDIREQGSRMDRRYWDERSELAPFKAAINSLLRDKAEIR